MPGKKQNQSIVSDETKKKLNLKIIGFAILVWILFQADIGKVITTLKQSAPGLLLLAFIFMIIHIFIKFMRYQYILKQLQIHVPLLIIFRFSLAALYLSFVTPGRIGELAKAYFIHKSYETSLYKPLASSIVDRIFDVYMLLLTALFGFIVINPEGVNSRLMITIIVVCGLLPFFAMSSAVRKRCISIISLVEKRFHDSPSWSNQIDRFLSTVRKLFSWKSVWPLLATIFAYALFFLSCFFMVLSIGIPLTVHEVAVFVACANILSFLPISFAGIGTREAALIFFFSRSGLSSESALAFSTLIFAFTYLLLGVIGFFSFITLQFDRKDIPYA